MLAYNLSTAVLEWHAAGSIEERVSRGICVLWKPPQIAEVDENPVESAEESMDVDQLPQMEKSDPLAIVDYGSDDEDEDDEIDKEQDVVDVLEPKVIVQDALNEPHDTVINPEPVEPKKEEVDDPSALQIRIEDSGDPPQHPASEGNLLKAEESSVAAVVSLKPTSTDPVLGSNPRPIMGGVELSTSPSKSSAKSKIYAPLRERIAYSDERKLFLDLDDLDPNQVLSPEQSVMEGLPPPPDLSAIFPDLPPFGLLDVAPPLAPGSSTEGKKKSEKRSEKDDPNKRIEDTTYTKLTHLGRFMYCKPTLLGPLQPAKRWRNGQWHNLDEGAITPDSEGTSLKVVNDSACGRLLLISVECMDTDD